MDVLYLTGQCTLVCHLESLFRGKCSLALLQHISPGNIWDMQEHRVHLQFTFTVFKDHLCEAPLGIPCLFLIPFFPSLGFDT